MVRAPANRLRGGSIPPPPFRSLGNFGQPICLGLSEVTLKRPALAQYWAVWSTIETRADSTYLVGKYCEQKLARSEQFDHLCNQISVGFLQ